MAKTWPYGRGGGNCRRIFPIVGSGVVDINNEFLIVDLTVEILLQFPHLCLALLAVLEFLHKPVHVFEHEHCGDVQNVVVRGLWYEYVIVVVVRLWMWKSAWRACSCGG